MLRRQFVASLLSLITLPFIRPRASTVEERLESMTRLWSQGARPIVVEAQAGEDWTWISLGQVYGDTRALAEAMVSGRRVSVVVRGLLPAKEG